jgi:hypothetical protein
LDALDHGFCSVEADVFLVGDTLLVAHDAIGLRPARTLGALYLEPLRERVKKNGGRVYKDPAAPSFTLMIDFKTEAEPTYKALDRLLAGYSDVLTVVRDGKPEPKAVSIVISGNRPIKTLAAAKIRYAGFDGRLSDLKSDVPDHLMPWISDNWRNHFRWRGDGPISDEERQKLRDLVKQAHARKRKLRFWAAPDNATAWKLFAECGVDLINTDDLAGLARVLNGVGSLFPEHTPPR